MSRYTYPSATGDVVDMFLSGTGLSNARISILTNFATLGTSAHLSMLLGLQVATGLVICVLGSIAGQSTPT